MKRLVSILLVFLILFLSSCKSQEIIHEESKIEDYTLDLQASKQIGYKNLNKASDLISTAKKVNAEDIFEVEKFEIMVESQTPPQITVVNGKVYAAVIRDDFDCMTHVYEFDGDEQLELYVASDISSLFEHNGYLFFCAADFSEQNTYKLMKYDPNAKTLICLNQISSTIQPIYKACGDYISITGISDLSLTDINGKLYSKCDIIFCDFSSKKEIYVDIFDAYSNDNVVTIKDVKNNFYVTYNKRSSKLIFNDVDAQEEISQVSLDVINQYDLVCKIFGNRLLMRDTYDIVVYDFASDKYKLIYKRERLCNCEKFGMICEILSDVVVFCDCDTLYAYDMKNDTVATICPLQDASYSGTDNETSFAFCKANVEIIDGKFYYIINNYKLK